MTLPNDSKQIERKTIAVIASTMRSGSTLLKALLGEAADVSHLPEVDFQRYAKTEAAEERIGALSKLPIVVLKKPAWYFEIGRYPRRPKIAGLKTILLVRDCYETVASLRKMTFGPLAGWLARFSNRFLAERYWAGVTANLLHLRDRSNEAIHLVRYEDLLADPVAVTETLFAFLGSTQANGINSYSKPAKFRWRWGVDDASDRIKSLTVQAPRDHGYRDRRLLEVIRSSEKIADLRRQLGYPALPK